MVDVEVAPVNFKDGSYRVAALRFEIDPKIPGARQLVAQRAATLVKAAFAADAQLDNVDITGVVTGDTTIGDSLMRFAGDEVPVFTASIQRRNLDGKRAQMGQRSGSRRRFVVAHAFEIVDRRQSFAQNFRSAATDKSATDKSAPTNSHADRASDAERDDFAETNGQSATDDAPNRSTDGATNPFNRRRDQPFNRRRDQRCDQQSNRRCDEP